MKLALLSLLPLGIYAQTTLSFSPQQSAHGVTTWAVTACGGTVQPARIYAVAGQHGLTWLLPSSAVGRQNQRSGWANLVRYGGFAAMAASALVGFHAIAVSPAIEAGITAGGGFLGVLVPVASKQLPVYDSSVGMPLNPDASGCGVTQIYAASMSKEAPFSVEVAPIVATGKQSLQVQYAGVGVDGETQNKLSSRQFADGGCVRGSLSRGKTCPLEVESNPGQNGNASASFEMPSTVSAEFLTR